MPKHRVLKESVMTGSIMTSMAMPIVMMRMIAVFHMHLVLQGMKFYVPIVLTTIEMDMQIVLIQTVTLHGHVSSIVVLIV